VRHFIVHTRRASIGSARPLNCGVMRPTDLNASPEMETLDQLLGGDQKLSVLRQVFPSDQRFVQGIAGLLRDGDVLLLAEGVQVAEWQVRTLFRHGEVLSTLDRYALHLTHKGAQKTA
jgi:hypothetical protein